MKSRVRANAPRKIIGYKIKDEKLDALKTAAQAMKSQLSLIGEESAGKIVGFLAGFNGFSESGEEPLTIPDKECIIFSGFDNKTLDILLDKFDEVGFDTDLKCVVTQKNQKLPLYELIHNLSLEHEEMSK